MSKTELLERLFKQTSLLPHIIRVSGDLIPFPENGNSYKDHLYINCVYGAYDKKNEANVQIDLFRNDIMEVLNLINKNITDYFFHSVVASLFVSPSPGENLRVYCAIVDVNCLINMNKTTFITSVKSEYSGLPYIQEMFKNNATNGDGGSHPA
jgi:hypothetical protein